MAADDESTRGTVEAVGGVIGLLVTMVAGWFGLRKQQVQSETQEHETDSKDRQRLGDRIDKLEKALDSKDEQIETLQNKIMQLSDDRGRLQLDMGKAIAKCGGCSYCNCTCQLCLPCTNKNPKGEPKLPIEILIKSYPSSKNGRAPLAKPSTPPPPISIQWPRTLALWKEP